VSGYVVARNHKQPNFASPADLRRRHCICPQGGVRADPGARVVRLCPRG